ncbi:MAG: exonuclease SbcCD subunit D [Ruminococcaceae bacterium]|nr:exonuclease SbcCD subunit D [Oscillospiraceae bacterium]
MIRILHCADLHLDSPFSSLDAMQSEERRHAQRELFRALICHAKNRRIDLLLIAGDLFDSGFTSSSTVKFVGDMLGTLDCPVVISPGNHDPYIEGGLYTTTFPENVYIFSSEKLSSFYFSKINVCVHGYAFTSERHEENPLTLGVSIDPTKINILCAHTELDVPLSHYAPITSNQLAASGFDYAALGHVHNPKEPVTLGKTRVRYSGCLEGRSFDELDFGGAVEVVVDGNTVTDDWIRFAKQRYMIETLDISGTEKDSDVIDRIRQRIAVNNYRDDTALRVILSGNLTPDYTPNLVFIKDEIEGIYRLDLKDETSPLLDFAELERDMSIRGEYYRELVAKMRTGDEQERRLAAEALRIGLCALSGKPIIF